MHQLLVVLATNGPGACPQKVPVSTVEGSGTLPRKDATWRWANDRNRELALGLNRPAVVQVADTLPGARGTVTDAWGRCGARLACVLAGRPFPGFCRTWRGACPVLAPRGTDWMLAHLAGRDIGMPLHLRLGQLPHGLLPAQEE